MRYFGKANKDLLEAKGKIPYWVIAEKLQVHEVTLNRWLRKELSPERKEKILEAIKEVKKNEGYV